MSVSFASRSPRDPGLSVDGLVQVLRARARRLSPLAVLVVAAIAVSGCSFSAGGWSACFLDHSNVSVTVSHPHGAPDPNAPN